MRGSSFASTRLSLALLFALTGAFSAGCAGQFDDYYAAEDAGLDAALDATNPDMDTPVDGGEDASTDQGPDLALPDFGSGPFDLDVAVGGTGAGAVVSAPTGINCGADCTHTYSAGTNVTLIATPVSPAVVEWGGACAGTGAEDPCILTMNQPRSVTVNFVIPVYTLTVVYAGAGTGNVEALDASLSCNGTGVCTATYEVGTPVTLTANAAFLSTFSGWSMDCAGFGDCELIMDADKRVGVTFDDSDEVSMLISRAGTGQGTVTSDPVGIDCGGTCSSVFLPGQVITLTAVQAEGSTFVGWTGDCTGTGLTCVLTMSAARSVTATFDRNIYTVSVERAGTGEGAVVSVPTLIDCGTTCSAPYAHGSSVTLAASPSEGSTFTGWSGACGGTNTLCNLTVTASAMATATFARNLYPLTASVTGPGKIQSGAGGIDCGFDCFETYEHGRLVTLNAIANDGATFTGWTGACAGELTNSCVITMTAAATVAATFALNEYTVVASTTDVGEGTITSDVGSIDCGIDCDDIYTHGTMVTFTATAADGSTFIGWGGDCASAPGDTCTLGIVADTTISAAFVIGNEFLTVTKVGTGQGTVVSDVPGIHCGGTCASSFLNGTVVELTATAALGSTFTGWSGGMCSDANPTCTVTVDDMISVTAEFTVDQHTITIDPVGEGTGTVSNNSGSILCGTGGSLCSDLVNYGTTRTLSASADAGSVFTGWSGVDCVGTGPCIVSVTSDITVTATFERAPYVLTVAKGGTGTGTVVSDLAGINCGGDCEETYRHGDIVTLTATPSDTSTFTGWSGAGCGVATQCVVTLTQAITVTAQFTLKQHILSVSREGNGAGTISSSPVGISCGATCAASFTHGTLVMLTAMPSTGSDFTGWGGACSGTAECMVTMDQARSVTATFTLKRYALTVNRSGTGTGTISSTPAGVTCPSSGACTGTFNHGTAVQLVASPSASSDLTSWSGGNCSGNGTCTVNLSAATTVTATFTLKQQPLMVSVSGAGAGTVTSNTGGINCTKAGGTCSTTYTHGTSVTLTAMETVGGGNTFGAWGGACTGVLTNMCVVTMTEARNVSATFTIGSNNLTVSVGGGGKVTSEPGSIDCGDGGTACSESFTFGQGVRLYAEPSEGQRFVSWGGACLAAGANTTCDVTMDASKTAVANFDSQTYPVDVTIDREGWGRVESPGREFDCPDNCVAEMAHGTTITLQALPSPGYVFDGWVDDTPGASDAPCSDLNPVYCTFTVTSARTLRAKFSPLYHTVTVSRSGDGVVGSNGAGILCGTACSGSYPTATLLELSAAPGVGSDFSHWTGACAGQGANCSLTITAPVSTQAVFVLQTYTVGVSFTGMTQGHVVATNNSIACMANGGAGCSATISYGTSMALVASNFDPVAGNPGGRFIRWAEGPCANSTSTSCGFTVTGPVAAVAEYARTRSFTINITGGALTSNERVGRTTEGASVVCGFSVGQVPVPCTVIVREGNSVRIEAMGSYIFGSGFNNWVPTPPGCSSSNQVCTFTMPPANLSVAANFQ